MHNPLIVALVSNKADQIRLRIAAQVTHPRIHAIGSAGLNKCHSFL
jgi:hypothetical protein